MRRRALLLLLPLLLPAIPPSLLRAEEAAPVLLEVAPDRTKATVGDRILVKITVTRPRDVTILTPSAVEGEGGNFLLEAAQAPPSGAAGRKAEEPAGGSVRQTFFFSAQAFETGTVSLPPFRVDWQGPGGKTGSVTSKPVPIEIVSVLKGPQEEPADLKPPAELPRPPFPWKTAGLILLLLALLAAAVALLRRRRRPAPALEPAPAGPAVPPHEMAYRELERLLASGLLRAGRIKEFHVELSEIVKRYLAGRFAIETLERTSEEVLEEMQRVRVGTVPQGLARDLLGETDLVKFAKYLPLEEEIRRTVDRAYRLVDQTKLIVQPEPAPSSPPPALSPEAAP